MQAITSKLKETYIYCNLDLYKATHRFTERSNLAQGGRRYCHLYS